MRELSPQELPGSLPLRTLRLVELLGQNTSRSLSHLGQMARLAGQFFRHAFSRPFEWTEFLVQCERIGLSSLPIAAITLLFVGLVFAFQFGVTLQTMGAIPYVGKVAGISIVRELGPVFTALVVGGRVGAGIAAELGSMRVTEQIDAIAALGASPYKKLLVPRVFAATCMIPIVALMAMVFGLLGAMSISWLEFNVSPVAFYQSALSSIYLSDFASGFLKPFFFGFGIAIIGCYEGFTCAFGTAGVGRATTRAVVSVSLMVVLMDFFLTRFFALFPRV